MQLSQFLIYFFPLLNLNIKSESENKYPTLAMVRLFFQPRGGKYSYNQLERLSKQDN